MTATERVVLILGIEGIVLALILAVIFVNAIWSRRARAARERRLSVARAIIATRLESKQLAPEDVAMLRALPGSDQRRLLFEVAPSVGESERAWLRQIAMDLGVFGTATTELRSSLWHVRLRASRLLTLVDADPDVMHPLLLDRDANVRAQGASYIAQHPTAGDIHALIGMLGDPEALCRFAAKDALMRLGGSASAVMLSRLANPEDPEIIPMLEVACVTASHDYLETAIRHLDHPSAAVRLLIARLLRGIGGREAADHLVRLTADPAPRVREAAAEALGYLNHWTASGPVAKLLEDPESRVRLAAALALDQLGPTGELLLRRSKMKGSERAAAAASRILDDPSRARPATA